MSIRRLAFQGARGVFVLAVALLAPAFAPAAEFQEDVGFSSSHMYEAGKFGETVDVTTGNLVLTVPIGPTYQVKNLSYGVTLTYNSKIWRYVRPYLQDEDLRRPYLKAKSFFGVGWTFHAGRVFLDPNADDVNPEVIHYESPDGSQTPLYFDSSDGFYYSKDSTFLRATSYTLTSPSMKVWKVWMSDGTSRLLGYKLGTGKPAKRGHGNTNLQDSQYSSSLNIVPGDLATGWYTIRVESVEQQNLDAPVSGVCSGDPTLRFSGMPPEVPCAYVEYFYSGSPNQPTGPGPWLPSAPISQSGDWLQPTYITDSVGRRISFAYQPDVQIHMPGPNGIATYALDYRADHITAPQGENHYDDDGQGGCVHDGTTGFISGTGTPDDPKQVQMDLLASITDPEGHAMSFGYFEDDCSNHGMMTTRVLPTGARSEYEYQMYRIRADEDISYSVTRRRFIVDGVTAEWQYGRDPQQVHRYGAPPGENVTTYSNPPRVYEVDPDGHMTIYHVYNNHNGFHPGTYGRPFKVERTKGGGDGVNFVSREEYDFEYENQFTDLLDEGSQAQTILVNLRQFETRRSVFFNDGGVQTQLTRHTDYAGFGRYRKTTEYHLANDSQPYRTTERVYFVEPGSTGTEEVNLLSKWILHPVKSVQVREGATGPLVSKAETLDFDRWGNPEESRSYPEPANPEARYVVTESTYDEWGMLSETEVSTVGEAVPSAARKTTYERDAAGHVLWRQLHKEDGSPYSWKAFDRDVQLTTGLPTATRTPAGVEATYAYDNIGRLTLIDPAGSVEHPTVIAYPTLQESIVSQGPFPGNQVKMRYLYDQAGRLVRQERLNHEGEDDAKVIDYDLAGRKVFESEWRAASATGPWPGTLYEYWVPRLGPAGPVQGPLEEGNYLADPFGRVTRVRAADGAETETSYDGLATAITVFDLNRLPGSGTSVGTFPTEATTVYSYDAFGRMTAVDAPEGLDAAYTFDHADRLVRVDMGSQVRAFTYDGLGRLTSSNNPENGLTTFEAYDAAGQVVRRRDAAGTATRFDYDGAGRIVREVRETDDPIPTPENPNPPNHVNQILKTYAYDLPWGEADDRAAGRLVAVTSYEIENALFDGNIDYGALYDRRSRVTREFRYEGLNGRLSQESLKVMRTSWGWQGWVPSTAFTTSYAYDAWGNVEFLSYPGIANNVHEPLLVNYGYRNGFLSSVGEGTNLNHETFLQSVTYNPAGGKQRLTYANATLTDVLPDALNRPSNIIVTARDLPPLWSALSEEGEGLLFAANGEPKESSRRASWSEGISDWKAWLKELVFAGWSSPLAARVAIPYGVLAQSCDPGTCELVPKFAGEGGGGGGLNWVEKWGSGLYKYDGAGNIIGIGQDQFKYDAVGRLVSAVMDNLPGISTQHTLTYQYDGWGNMTERRRSTPTSTFTWSFQCAGGGGPNCHETNRLQQLTAATNEVENYSFTYDAVGNMTADGDKGYVFDLAGKLTEVRHESGQQAGEVMGRYAYDDRGYRVWKEEGGFETFYVRDLGGQVLSEYRRPVNPVPMMPAWSADYVYALGQAVALVKNDRPLPPLRIRSSFVVEEATSTMDVTLSWAKSTEADILGYRVYRKDESCAPCPWEGLFQAPTGVTVEHDPDEEAPDPIWYDNDRPLSAYSYYVVVVDEAQYVSSNSRTLLLDGNDVSLRYVEWEIPPVANGDNRVELRWELWYFASRVVEYKVWRKGQGEPSWSLRGAVESPGWVDTGLVNGESYRYKVTAVNTRGVAPDPDDPNVAPAEGVLGEPEDTVPPAPPASTRGYPGPGEGEVTVRWSVSPAPDLAGYRVFRQASPDPVQVYPAGGLPALATAPRTATIAASATGYYFVVAYDDDDNASAPSPVVQVAPFYELSPGDYALEISDGFTEEGNERQIFEWGNRREAVSPTLEPLEALVDPASQFGWPVTFRAAGLLISWLEAGTLSCSSHVVYREESDGIWTLLTEEPLVGQPNPNITEPPQFCTTNYFDTKMSGLEHNYRVMRLSGSGVTLHYTYAHGGQPDVVMGQYAYGAKLVKVERGSSLPPTIVISPDGTWELGDLPRMSPVVVRWLPSPNPAVAGYRIWVNDFLRSTGGWRFLGQVGDRESSMFLDDEAPINWPAQFDGQGNLVENCVVSWGDGSPRNLLPCQTGDNRNYFANYIVQGVTDLESEEAAPEVDPVDTWSEAVRAVRIAHGECPESADFCDDDDCPENCQNPPVCGSEPPCQWFAAPVPPFGVHEPCRSACEWPAEWRGREEYRVDFTDPNAVVHPAYVADPGYEEVFANTEWPSLGGTSGTGVMGWLDTGNLETSNWEVFGPNATVLEGRYDLSVCLPNALEEEGPPVARTRTFKMQVEPNKWYYVDVAAGDWTGPTWATVSVNGVVYWDRHFLNTWHPSLENPNSWTGEVLEGVIQADANGFLEVTVGGAPSTSPYDPYEDRTCLAWVKVTKWQEREPLAMLFPSDPFLEELPGGPHRGDGFLVAQSPLGDGVSSPNGEDSRKGDGVGFRSSRAIRASDVGKASSRQAMEVAAFLMGWPTGTSLLEDSADEDVSRDVAVAASSQLSGTGSDVRSEATSTSGNRATNLLQAGSALSQRPASRPVIGGLVEVSPGAAQARKIEETQGTRLLASEWSDSAARARPAPSHRSGAATPASDRLVGDIPAYASIQWIHADHLGSTRLVTDEDGAVVSEHKYLPFGEEFSHEGAPARNTHKFTGHEREEGTGLDYMMARYQDSRFSRFISVDPNASSVRLGKPQTWNRFSYVINGPLIFADPDGEDIRIMTTDDPRLMKEAEKYASTSRVQKLYGPGSGRDLDIVFWEVSKAKFEDKSNDAKTELFGTEGSDDIRGAVIVVDPRNESGGLHQTSHIKIFMRHEFGHAVDGAESGATKYSSRLEQEKEQIANRIGEELRKLWKQEVLKNSLGLSGGTMGSTPGSEAAEELDKKQQKKINHLMNVKRNNQ